MQHKALANFALLASFAFGLVSVVGCEVVLGLEDHKLAPGNVLPGSTPLGGAILIASDQPGPRGIVSDEGSVYWGNADDQSVKAADKVENSPVREVVGSLVGSVGPVILEGTNLYFGLNRGHDCGTGKSYSSVWGAAKNGPTAWRAYQPPNCEQTMVAWHFNPTTIWWISNNGKVFAHDRASGDYRVVLENRNGVGALLTVGPYLYLSDTSKGMITQYLLPDGPAIDFATRQPQPIDLEADQDYLYWINTGGTVMRLAHNTPQVEPTQLATGQASPFRMAADSANLFWVNTADGAIRSVPKAGGDVVTVAEGMNDPYEIAADDRGVYWTTRGDNSVWMALR